jgi:hypothetical protein
MSDGREEADRVVEVVLRVVNPIAALLGIVSALLSTALIVSTLLHWTSVELASVAVAILGAGVALYQHRSKAILEKALLLNYRQADRIFARLKQKRDAVRDIALSVSFLDHYRGKNASVRWLLASCAFALLLGSRVFQGALLLELSAVSLAVLTLIVVKESILEYRIRNGYFGNNRAEAKEMIAFLVENSADIDFTDGGGRLRRILIDEEQGKARVNSHVGGGAVA